MNIFKNKKFKYGGLSLAITIVFIAAVILINIIVSMVLERIPSNIDLTENQLYSLSKETIEYIKNLDSEVEITVLAGETDFSGSELNEVFKNYERYSDKISLRYVDMVKNPGIQSSYNIELTAGGVIVESKDTERVRAFVPDDFYNYSYDDMYGYYITGQTLKADEVITSAIMYVTDLSPVTITIATGHQETELAYFESLLEKNGYIIEKVNLLTGEINPESDYVFICAPLIDYDEMIIDKLETYLDNEGKFGKNMIYIASYNQGDTPNIDSLLADWGLSVDSGILYQTDTNYVYMSYPWHFGKFVETSYAGTLSNPNMYMFIINSVPVNALFSTQGNMRVTPILSSYPGAVVAPLELPEGWTVADAGETGEYGVIIESAKSTYLSDNSESTGRVIAFGSADMFLEDILKQASFVNAEFYINMLNKISGKESGVTIAPKDMTFPKVEITEAVKNVLGIIFMAVIPICVLVLGIVVWLVRRHR